jgi:hypothetical protein
VANKHLSYHTCWPGAAARRCARGWTRGSSVYLIGAETFGAFCATALGMVGFTVEDPRAVADTLAEADLTGVETGSSGNGSWRSP